MLAVSGSARGKLGGSDASHTSREPEGHLHEVKVPPQASDTGATWTMEAATRSADHSRCLPVRSRQQLRRAPSRWLRGSGHYLAGALLWNFRCCFYGNQTATYFDCIAPKIDRYLQE